MDPNQAETDEEREILSDINKFAGTFSNLKPRIDEIDSDSDDEVYDEPDEGSTESETEAPSINERDSSNYILPHNENEPRKLEECSIVAEEDPKVTDLEALQALTQAEAENDLQNIKDVQSGEFVLLDEEPGPSRIEPEISEIYAQGDDVIIEDRFQPRPSIAFASPPRNEICQDFEFMPEPSSSVPSQYDEESQNFDDFEVDSDGDDEEPDFLNEEELEDKDDIPVSYHNALLLNENYQSELNATIKMLEDGLAENRARQEKLKEDIDCLEAGRPVKKHAENPIIARNPITIFYAPYFKDVNLYTHPPNEDTKVKRLNGEMDLYLANPREMTDGEKRQLYQAVKDEAINKRLKYLVNEEHEVLSKLRKAGISALEKIELRSRLRKFIAEETDIRSLPDSELFKDPVEEYDWLKIAAQTFNRSISEQTCRLMWLNNLHPSINRGKWSKQEDKKLRDLVNLPDEDGLFRQRKDWDRIAKMLGTNRTAFLCFHRYQIKYNKACNNRKWTKEEDLRLRTLVKQCRINRFVPWSKVSYYMHNRTKDQCYQRYVYSIRDEVKQGLFEEVEDHIILVGAKLFGNDWARISHFIPTRTPMQIHSRFNTFLKANFDNWTYEEDHKLLQIVREQGPKEWVKISLNFATRTRTQCRQRWFYIHKLYKRCPSEFSLSSLPYSEMDTKPKLKQQNLYENLNERVDEFLKMYKVKKEDMSDEEAIEDKIDANFSVEKTRCKTYHTTPDGERIPMTALYEFMRQLGSKLPKADDNMNKTYAKPKVDILSAKSLDHEGNLVKPGFSVEKLNALGTHHLHVQKKIAKIFRPGWPIRQTKKKEVYRKMSEIKIAKQAGHTLMDILSASDLIKTSSDPRQDLSSTLRKRKECKDNILDERQKQFFEIMQAKSEGISVVRHETLTNQAMSFKPTVKTYSRKTKQTPYLKPANNAQVASNVVQNVAQHKEYLKFVPPCLNTLVGFRGMLLACKNLANKDLKNGAVTSKKSILQTGLNDPIFGSTTIEASCSSPPLRVNSGEQTLSKDEADKRLRNRLISLFYWPAVMASARPNERRDVFDIVEEEEVVAACFPMDTTEIIAEAQSKASVNPKIVPNPRSQKRKSDAPKRVTFPDEVVANSEASQPSVAPPPYKKRLLVSIKQPSQ